MALSGIFPSHFDALTQDERNMLEALVQTYIETAQARRSLKPRRKQN